MYLFYTVLSHKPLDRITALDKTYSKSSYMESLPAKGPLSKRTPD